MSDRADKLVPALERGVFVSVYVSFYPLVGADEQMSVNN